MKTLPTASRRALLMGLAATATPMAPALANALSGPAPAGVSASEIDPIFEVIERHREAIAREDAAHRHFEEMDALYPVTPDHFEDNNPRGAAYDVWNDLCNGRIEITEELAMTPTTVVGLAALLQHWADIVGDDLGNFDNYDTTKLMTALANGLRGQA